LRITALVIKRDAMTTWGCAVLAHEEGAYHTAKDSPAGVVTADKCFEARNHVEELVAAIERALSSLSCWAAAPGCASSHPPAGLAMLYWMFQRSSTQFGLISTVCKLFCTL
jgi:hypothetical protein